MASGFRPGQKVLTPHPKYMQAGTVEGTYLGDAPDHVTPATLDGRSDRLPQGVVRYSDGSTKTWLIDAIQPA